MKCKIYLAAVNNRRATNARTKQIDELQMLHFKYGKQREKLCKHDFPTDAKLR